MGLETAISKQKSASAPPHSSNGVDSATFEKLWNVDTRSDIMAEIFGIKLARVYALAKVFDLRPRNSTGQVITIAKDDFASMWHGEQTIGWIGSSLKCPLRTVARLAEYFDLGPRLEPQPKPGRPKVTVAGAPFWTEGRDARVVLTSGVYAEVSELAKAMGIPTTKIMARWHVLRVAL